MYSATIAVCCVFLRIAHGLDDLSFPPGFKFGVSTAAYQVEGGWNVSDKGESVWDRYVHTRPEAILDGSNGDVACDSYHQWKRDVEMLGELGVHFYRFSISWPRLLPNGFSNKVSEDGVKYYSDLIDGLLETGIEPVVTLYHFDLPQILQDLGGWTNPFVVDWFADYARVCYSLFGARVKTWLTFNEPVVVCDFIYNTGNFPPGNVDPDVSPYLCNRHLLLAHAKAYRIFDEEFRPKYNVLYPFHVGRYSHPIYSAEGGWPPVLQRAFEDRSKEQGLPRSKLPDFTREEIDYIKGTFDYYGIKYYTSRRARAARRGEALRRAPLGDLPDLAVKLEKDPMWTTSHSPILYIYPEGMRHSLAWLKRQYGDIPVLVTENGYTDAGGLEDPERIHFYREHLEQILLSIKEDGVNVTGYTVWSLMDDFEWGSGYSSPFGLYQVDFSSPLRTRTPRASAAFYRQIIQQHSLNVTIT